MSYADPTIAELRAEHAAPPTCHCTGACGGDAKNCHVLRPVSFEEYLDDSIQGAAIFGNIGRAAKLRAIRAEIENQSPAAPLTGLRIS